MKKFLRIIFIILIVLTLNGCSNTKKQCETAQIICNALKTFDLETLNDYSKLKFEDSPFLAEDDYFFSIVENYSSKTKYNVINVCTDNDTSYVSIEIKYYDLSPIINNALDKYKEIFYPLKVDTSYVNLFAKSLAYSFDNVSPAYVTDIIVLKLKFIDDSWIADSIPVELIDISTCNIAALYRNGAIY